MGFIAPKHTPSTVEENNLVGRIDLISQGLRDLQVALSMTKLEAKRVLERESAAEARLKDVQLLLRTWWVDRKHPSDPRNAPATHHDDYTWTMFCDELGTVLGYESLDDV